MKNPTSNKKGGSAYKDNTSSQFLLTPFVANFKQIALPPLLLLVFSSLLYLIAPVFSRNAALFLSLFLFPLLSIIALSISLQSVISSFKSGLPQYPKKSAFKSADVRKRYSLSHLLSAALSVALWYICTLLSLLLIASQYLIFREIAVFVKAMTSGFFVFLSFALLFLTLPVLIALMCFCSVARARRIKKKTRIPPALLAFIPLYSITLIIAVIVFIITSFMDISFIAPLVGASQLIEISFLWYIILLVILDIAFSTFYFYYTIRLTAH
ncbi:MAG: hypothetical protein GX303_02830 [Clostridiales bacterium]|nr:hypothetical protein [Clostridiales bacterium]